MKHIVLVLCCLLSLLVKGSDTLFVETAKDARYLRYRDSIIAYETGFSVAKNMADTLRRIYRNASYENYFLQKYRNVNDTIAGGFFTIYNESPSIVIGHISDQYNARNEVKFPWTYLRSQYRRLDTLHVAPVGLLQGAELPDVYIYQKPQTTVVVRYVKRYTMVDPSIKFLYGKDGKTKQAYIVKYHYSQVFGELQKIDSIEKLHPITQQHLFWEE